MCKRKQFWNVPERLLFFSIQCLATSSRNWSWHTIPQQKFQKLFCSLSCQICGELMKLFCGQFFHENFGFAQFHQIYINCTNAPSILLRVWPSGSKQRVGQPLVTPGSFRPCRWIAAGTTRRRLPRSSCVPGARGSAACSAPPHEATDGRWYPPWALASGPPTLTAGGAGVGLLGLGSHSSAYT